MMMLKEGVLSALVSVGDSFNINFWWDSLLNWINSFFQKQQMELCVLGLPSAGKSSLVDAITTGSYEEDMIPTLGFNMREVTKGNVIIKIWDLGGQERARPMWEHYCRAVSAIVYVVDAVDIDFIPIAQRELHDLLKKPSLVGIPLLVLGNKIDLPGSLSEHVLINLLRLHSIRDREVCCYMISCKEKVNLEIVMEWLIKHSNSANAVKSSHLYTKEIIVN